jgi:hypothetical protein
MAAASEPMRRPNSVGFLTTWQRNRSGFRSSSPRFVTGISMAVFRDRIAGIDSNGKPEMRVDWRKKTKVTTLARTAMPENPGGLNSGLISRSPSSALPLAK